MFFIAFLAHSSRQAAESRDSAFHLHILAGRIAERRVVVAAGLPGSHFFGCLRREPVCPVRPPASGMFCCSSKPVCEASLRPWACPILIFGLAGRIDDACDMA